MYSQQSRVQATLLNAAIDNGLTAEVADIVVFVAAAVAIHRSGLHPGTVQQQHRPACAEGHVQHLYAHRDFAAFGRD
jgi:hypothetical protein